MNGEFIDQIIALVGVCVGASIGFIGNYLLNRREFKQKQIFNKEEHLKELLNEFIEIVNSEFSLIEEVLSHTQNEINSDTLSEEEVLNQITHLESLNRKIDEKMKYIHVIESKYDFTEKIGLLKEMNEFKNILFEFLQVIDTNQNMPTNENSLFIDGLINRLASTKISFKSKVRAYYSEKFLPNE